MSAVKRSLALDAGLILMSFFLLLSVLSAGAPHAPDVVVLAAVSTTLTGLVIGFASGFYATDPGPSQRLLRRGAVAVAVCAAAGLALQALPGGHDGLSMAVATGLPMGVAAMIGVRALHPVLRDRRRTRRVLVIAPEAVLHPFGGGAPVPASSLFVDEPITVAADGAVPEPAVSRIGAFCASGGRERVIAIAGGVQLSPAAGATLLAAAQAGCRIRPFTEFMAETFGRLPLEDADTPAGLLYARQNRSRWTAAAERLVDLAATLVLMTTAVPLMVAIALAIRAEDRGPILFRQKRVGLNGRVFTLLKFRTMRTDAEADGRAKWAQEKDSRVTRIGALLRAHRLDELPQLLNVLKGEMSLVGPRPERPEIVAELRRHIPLYDFRHCALPGLTGWAQINYPYGASIEEAAEKTRYDLFYIQKRSPLLDIYILLQTIRVVIFAEGAR